MRNKTIIVLTPVKNEEWILDRFLEVTTRFADFVIIADQQSEDRTREIAEGFSKVWLIENREEDLDERSRSQMMISEARRLVGGPKILLALDADEMLAANALATEEWRDLQTLQPGTVLGLEKVTLYGGFQRCIRYRSTFAPLGYVDDGAEFEGKRIHGPRVPVPDGAPVKRLEEVKVIHYALFNLEAQRAKERMYSVLERDGGNAPLYMRRHRYSRKRDFRNEGPIEPVREEWFEGWEKVGIGMRTVAKEWPYWHDFEVLRRFRANGCRRYWLDDVWDADWDADWDALAEEGARRGRQDMPEAIERPPLAHRIAGELVVRAYGAYRSVKKLLRG